MLPGINRNQKARRHWSLAHPQARNRSQAERGTAAGTRFPLGLLSLSSGAGGFFLSFWLEAFPHKERSPSNGEQKPN